MSEEQRQVAKEIVTHRARANALLQELTLEELGKLAKLTKDVIAQKEHEELEYLKKMAAKREHIEKIRELMDKSGVTAEDLNSPPPPTEVYEFRESDGTLKRWTGRGRMPDRLKALVSAGSDLNKFKVS